VTSYQKVKNKRLIYMQTIMNAEVYLSMLRSYLKVSVVATTRHSRTNDLTTSKALQWAIK